MECSIQPRFLQPSASRIKVLQGLVGISRAVVLTGREFDPIDEGITGKQKKEEGDAVSIGRRNKQI